MKRILIIAGIITLLILITGCTSTRQNVQENNPAMQQDSQTEHGLIGGSASKYYDWNKTKFEHAVQEGKKIYLEFSADWCSICQKQELHLKAGFIELNDPNVVGFKINYNDDQTTPEMQALAEQYQIPYQHTKVVLKNGKQAIKSPESWTKDRFLEEMRKIQHEPN